MLPCEVVTVGDCDMSEDIMAAKLENVERLRKRVYMCVCYMTVEDPGAHQESKCKYDIVRKFVNEPSGDRVFIEGDMNRHTGLLGERMNENEGC